MEGGAKKKLPEKWEAKAANADGSGSYQANTDCSKSTNCDDGGSARSLVNVEKNQANSVHAFPFISLFMFPKFEF